MSKKHLIIKDADEDIEYDIEEVAAPEEAEEVKEEEVIEHKEEVCPECGKEPCECKPAPEQAVFTEEEIGALKKLISIVPELEKLLAAKPEEEQHEVEEEEQPEIKEIEEVEEKEEDIVEEDEDLDEESADTVSDSVGSIESTIGDSIEEEASSTEIAMAERFKKYYGGN